LRTAEAFALNLLERFQGEDELELCGKFSTRFNKVVVVNLPPTPWIGTPFALSFFTSS